MNSSLLRGAPRVLGAAALLTALLTSPAAAATAEAPGGACTGDDGVTVVVDFTDSGGDIEVGCAHGPQDSGRAALEAAGFAPEDSTPGMICAINSTPDQCPEEFDGNFWSYWHAGADGEWESYMVGADEARPEPGGVEGWRYFDGSAGPGLTPAEAQAGPGGEVSGAEAGEPAGEQEAGGVPSGEDSSPVRGVVMIVAGVAVIGVIAATLARRRNQAND